MSDVSRMSRAEELAALLEVLDFTNKDLSRLCEVTSSTVQRWLAGSGPIPMAVIRMLVLMVHVKRASVLLDVNHEHPQIWLDEQLQEMAP